MRQHSATPIWVSTIHATESAFGRKTFNFRSTLTFTAENVIIFMILFRYKIDAVQPQTCFTRVNCYFFIVSHHRALSARRRKLYRLAVSCHSHAHKNMMAKMMRCDEIAISLNAIAPACLPHPILSLLGTLKTTFWMCGWQPFQPSLSQSLSLSQLETKLTTTIRSMQFTCLDEFPRRLHFSLGYM